MWDEHMQYWLKAVTCEDRSDTENWDRVVDIPQTDFWYGRLHMECTWQVVVLIPKDNGEFKGIGIVKVLWNVLLGIINCSISATVQFHDMMNGFR